MKKWWGDVVVGQRDIKSKKTMEVWYGWHGWSYEVVGRKGRLSTGENGVRCRREEFRKRRAWGYLWTLTVCFNFPGRERNRQKINCFIFFLWYERVRQGAELRSHFLFLPLPPGKLPSLSCVSHRDETSMSDGTTKEVRMQGERNTLLYILYFSGMTSSLTFSYFLLYWFQFN